MLPGGGKSWDTRAPTTVFSTALAEVVLLNLFPAAPRNIYQDAFQAAPTVESSHQHPEPVSILEHVGKSKRNHSTTYAASSGPLTQI